MAMFCSRSAFRSSVTDVSVLLQQYRMRRLSPSKFAGNEVYYTASSLLVILNNSCSKLHYQIFFKLQVFSQESAFRSSVTDVSVLPPHSHTHIFTHSTHTHTHTRQRPASGIIRQSPRVRARAPNASKSEKATCVYSGVTLI